MSVFRNKSQRPNKKHMGNNLKIHPNKTRRRKKYKGGNSNEDKILAMAGNTNKDYDLVRERKENLKKIVEKKNKAPEGNKKELLQQFNAATQALEEAENNLNKHLENPESEGNNNDVVIDKTGPFKRGGRVLICVVIIVGIAAVTAN